MEVEKTEHKTVVKNNNEPNSAIVEQSHMLESLIGETKDGTVTGYSLEITDIDNTIQLELTDSGELIVLSDQDLSDVSTFEPTDVEDLSLFSDLPTQAIENGINVDVPVQGTSDTYVSLTVNITVHMELECTDLVEPIYYKVELSKYTLGEVFSHSYLREFSSKDPTDNFQHLDVRVRFCEMDKIKIEEKAPSRISRIRQKILSPFGRNVKPENTSDDTVDPIVGELLIIGIAPIFSTILFVFSTALLPVEIASIILYLGIGVTIVGGLYVLMTVLAEKYRHKFSIQTDSKVETPGSETMFPVDTIGSTLSEMTVEINEYNGSIYLTDTENGDRWKLPEQNNALLTEESTEFIRSIGTENIGSTVTLQTAKNDHKVDDLSCIKIASDRYFYI